MMYYNNYGKGRRIIEIDMTQVNLSAVLVAAVVAFIIGGLWYGPLFGRKWLALTGMPPGTKPAGARRAMLVQFLMTVISAFVLALFVSATPGATVAASMTIAFWIWLGFIATTMTGEYLFVAAPDKQKPWALYWFNVLYYLVTLVVMGIILVIWK